MPSSDSPTLLEAFEKAANDIVPPGFWDKFYAQSYYLLECFEKHGSVIPPPLLRKGRAEGVVPPIVAIDYAQVSDLERSASDLSVVGS